MKKSIRTLIVVMAIVCANLCAQAAPPLAMIQKAKATVENARYQLPIEITPGLMLTQLSYDSKTYTLVYRYHYTVPVQKPTASAIREAKLSVIHMLKANPNSDDMKMLKSGISFHYNYYTSEGTFLFATKITSADVK